MHHSSVGFELDLWRELADGLRGQLAPFERHQGVAVAVALQDRD